MSELSKGVRRILREAGGSYSLGATVSDPPKSADGFRVELVSRRPGVVIHVRPHAVPRPAGERAREAAEAVTLFGGGDGGEVELPVELRLHGDERSRGPRRREVGFEVRIPISALELEEKAGARQADVELIFLAVDGAGDVSDPVTRTARLRVPGKEWEAARTATWPWGGKLVVRPDTRRLTVTVRDIRSNRLGTAEADRRID